jgi:proline iminopeptidase
MTGRPSRHYADFPPHPASASEARRHVRATLTIWRLPHLIDSAQLLVSELIGNAVKAATTSPIRLTLDPSPSHLLIEVWDPDPAPPIPKSPTSLDEGGRGLLLVEALAETWGHHPTPHGKTVWCTLPTAPGNPAPPPPVRPLQSSGDSRTGRDPGTMADDRYPPIEPYATGMLDVGDGNHMYWEASGNPGGKPSLVVHGGPGSGSSPGTRRFHDPGAYRVIQFDQRGCGRSTPHASDPSTSMTANTTHHLIADMERLRDHLGIDRWQLFGGSWGSTLILAYAERHPHRVTEILLSSVTTTRPAEIDWLYKGVGRFFPEQWHRFHQAVPETDRHDLLSAYALLMEHPDLEVREKAALSWCTWEDAVISQEPNGVPGAYTDRPGKALLAFVRICAHYFSHNAWLEEDILLKEAHRLKGIPAVLLHGRLDLGSPLDTAWHLSRSWPEAGLTVIDDAGHTGSETLRTHVLDALQRFAIRR